MTDSVRFHAFPLAGIEPMTACTARSFPRHTHDQYGFGVVDAGGHASFSGRGQVEAGPGRLICVNPGEVHDGRAVGGRSRAWRLLYVDPARMAELCADVRDGAEHEFTFAAPVFADEEVRRLFDAAFACSRRDAGQGDALACESAMLALVARLLVHTTARPITVKPPTASIRGARERIDSDPSAAVTLTDLAREVGVSRYQLIRAFAREVGLTPHAYLLQKRIELARRLILAGRALAEAASDAGFCDQSHLTRCFVRHYGVTPHRYASRA